MTDLQAGAERQAREQTREQLREQERQIREDAQRIRQEAEQAAREAQRAAQEAAREAQQAAQEAAREAAQAGRDVRVIRIPQPPPPPGQEPYAAVPPPWRREPDIPPEVVDIFQMFTVATAAVLILRPMMRAWANRFERRGAAPAALPPEVSAHMQRLEHAIEAVAIEVERISEGQRYTTKLLAERGKEG